MGVSQFTVYTSYDAGGPGPLTGQVGTLLALLDACLVNGYPGKAAAGWTKFTPNALNLGTYTQGAGSGLSCVINDTVGNEARITGWESVAGIGSPVGTGVGQFPLPAQSLTDGHVTWRKSATSNATGRTWILFADASTFYLFIRTEDYVGCYASYFFGDIFSVKSGADNYKCMVIGRGMDNTATRCVTTPQALAAVAYSDMFDLMGWQVTYAQMAACEYIGHYIARNVGGTLGSLSVGKYGNMSYGGRYSLWAGASSPSVCLAHYSASNTPPPNSPDNALYFSPIWVMEGVGSSGLFRRGRMRGLWQVEHVSTSFYDGQILTGAGDFAGKTFQIVLLGWHGSSFWAVETSNTVETN